MTWSDDTKPPASSVSTTPSKPRDFKLVIDLAYCDGMGKSATVVYEGYSADTLKYTIRLEDRSKLQIQDSNLQLIDQPDLSKLPKTPLEYWNEVGTGIILQEAQALSRPHTLSPL